MRCVSEREMSPALQNTQSKQSQETLRCHVVGVKACFFLQRQQIIHHRSDVSVAHQEVESASYSGLVQFCLDSLELSALNMQLKKPEAVQFGLKVLKFSTTFQKKN